MPKLGCSCQARLVVPVRCLHLVLRTKLHGKQTGRSTTMQGPMLLPTHTAKPTQRTPPLEMLCSTTQIKPFRTGNKSLPSAACCLRNCQVCHPLSPAWHALHMPRAAHATRRQSPPQQQQQQRRLIQAAVLAALKATDCACSLFSSRVGCLSSSLTSALPRCPAARLGVLSAYMLSWKVRAITSSCWSLVSLLKCTA